ncbi:MAG: heparinase II/III family protein [Verrucomicrobia bacterium]|nr:heparinase II/III family protein [Verrucomicrobiota bacterium]
MRALVLLMLTAASLAAATAPHPRVFFPTAAEAPLKQRIHADPLAKQLHAAAILLANSCLKDRTVRYEIPDGKRLLAESRRAIKCVLLTAYACRMTGEPRYLERCILELDAACALKDWNPSHFLDVAEMATAVAIGYDWLYPQLSPAQRQRYETALRTHALAAIAKRNDGWWHGPTNNWSQVCSGGLMLAADALRDVDPDLSKMMLAHCRDLTTQCERFYQPEGAYPEGPNYWHYGTTYHVLAMALMERDESLKLAPIWPSTSHFLLHATGPSGMPFNYADANPGQADCSPAQSWLATRTRDPLAITAVRALLTRRYATTESHLPNDRFLPLTLLWLPAPAPAAPSPPLNASFQGEQSLAFFRSSWTADALWLGIKGGTPAASHGHMDCGAFVLDWAGTRWFHDLGSDNYNLPGYFGGQRFSYFRLQNLSHNTLVIGNLLQSPKAKPCPLTPIQMRNSAATTTIDLTDACRGQCQQATRMVDFDATARQIIFTDHVLAPAGPVRWQAVTDAKVTLADHVATLERDGHRLVLTCSNPALAWITNDANPPTKTEKPNPNMKILSITAPATADLTLSIRLRAE